MKVYSRFKIFHHTGKLNSLGKTILPPISIRIKPTNHCNHNCWYCGYRRGMNLPAVDYLGKNMVEKDSLPLSKMRELVDNIDEMGVKSVILSGGGEPLCYEHIYDFVHRLKCSIAVLTNGTLLEGDIADLLSKKATWVRVSIDGWDKKSYLKYRGVDDFDKVIRNITNYKGYIGVIIVVDRQNSNHLYDMIRMFSNKGVDSIKISPVIVSGNILIQGAYHSMIEDNVADQIKRAKQDFPVEISDSYHAQMEKFEKQYHWCPYAQITPIIGADCNVYYCHDKAYTEKGLLGSIKNISFKDFWFNGNAKFYRIDPSKDCLHHCMCDNSNKSVIEYLDIEHKEFI